MKHLLVKYYDGDGYFVIAESVDVDDDNRFEGKNIKEIFSGRNVVFTDKIVDKQQVVEVRSGHCLVGC